ncbi:serine hydrolase [Nocardia sp. NPDC050710]|uniref:serine hydrolase domain-containing protein n=1 Tax=Nocardia sp. NPDC050710 TaxID=3157220 RepID=UPI00341109A4
MTEPPNTRSRPRRYATRAAIAFGLVVAVLIGIAFTAPQIMHIPGPITLFQLFREPPSTQGTLFASRTIPAARTPRPLPVGTAALPNTVPWKGSHIPVAEFLSTTKTNSFLIVRNGVLVHEWYRDGVEATTPQASWSVAKSVVSLLIGRAIEAGRLREEDRLVDILPELTTGTDYDTVTIRDLLDMASGIDVPENYNRLWPFTGTARMYLTEDLPGFLAEHRTVTFPPGSRGEYRSVDTQLLGAVLAKVDGRAIGDQLARDLWDPIGAQDEARWNLDHPGGQEKAFCCLNATARDFAKIGQLILDGGRANGTQIVPPAWIERIRKPAPNPISDWGYGAQWWHPSDGTGADLTALGVYGQYIYVDPPSATVIVKLSDYGTTQDEPETVEVFRTIANAPLS